METPPPQQPPQDPAPPQQPAPAPAPQAAYPHPPMGPSIRFDVIGQAFQMILSDIGTWVAAAFCIFLVVGAIGAVFFFTIFAILSRGGILGALVADMVMVFALVAVSNIMVANMYRMAIIALSGTKPSVNEMFKFGANSGNVIVAALLVGLASSIGMLACGIGSLVVSALLMFTMPIIVDRNLAPMDAITLSWNTLKKDVVMASIFFFVIGFCAEIGGVACGIGALFTLPVLPIAISMLYRDYLGFASTPS